MAERARNDRWRTPAILAGSVAFHVLVLGALGLKAVRLTDWRPEAPVVLIDIRPRPLLPDEKPREPRFAAAPPERVTARADGVPTRPRDEDEDDAPSPLTPHVPPTAPGARATDDIDEGWRVPNGPTARQAGRALRGSAIGCDTMRGRLSVGEQAQCDQAFNRVAGAAPRIAGSGDAARDGRFAAEGERQIQAYEDRRRPLAGGTGNVGPGDCPGSNFGTGCPGAHLDRGWRRDANDEMSAAQGRYAR